MPLITIELLEGRTEQQVSQLISDVTQAVEKSLASPRERIRVVVHEIPKTHWGIGGETAKKLGR